MNFFIKMYFSLRISSKNKNSLKKFLLFVSKIKNPIMITCNYPQPKKKSVITVLKSPHINKTAQDQFEFKIYSKNIIVWSPQPKLLIIFLKKLIKTGFSGVQIQIYSFVGTEVDNKFLLNSLNPNVLNNFFFINIHKKKLLTKKMFKYLNLFDCFGELILVSKFI